jgi:nucleotide-binding universal stress UspA family protein
LAGFSHSSTIQAAGEVGVARPVLLATLEAPFDDDAVAFAVDSAVEAGAPLIVVNVVELLLAPCSLMLGYDVPESAEDAEAIATPARLAASLGVEVERLRVQSPHPVDALLEVVAERSPGLLVFGPDRTRVRSRCYRRAVRAIRERTTCLVWLAD